MKQEDAKVCPNCGTRNKAKWDICVSCGESLEAVTIVASAAAPAIVTRPSEGPTSSAGGMLFALVFMGAAVGFGTWWVKNRPPAESTVDPANFALPAPPPPAPPQQLKIATDLDKAIEEARLLLSRGDAAGAARLLGPLVSDNGNNAALRRMYGQAQVVLGNKAEALSNFQEAVRLSPNEPEYRLAVAGTLTMMGRSDDAIEEYKLLLGAVPDHQAAQRELASLYDRLGRYAEAIPLLTQASATQPNDMVVLQELAYAQDRAGQADASKATYQRLVQAAPDATLPRAHLADLLFRQGDQAGAMALLDEGLKRDPNAPLLRRTRAAALEKMGRVEEAIAEYRTYVKVAPNAEDAPALSDRASMLEKRLAAGASS